MGLRRGVAARKGLRRLREPRSLRVAARRRPAHFRRDDRCPADRARCEDGEADPWLRRTRDGGPAEGPSDPADRFCRLSGHLTTRGDWRHHRRRLRDFRRHRLRAPKRRSARVPCRDRQVVVELGSRSAGFDGRRRGHLEGGERQGGWRRQRVVGHRRRRRTESRVRPDEQSQSRLLRRRAHRRQPV